jgi:protein CpxP
MSPEKLDAVTVELKRFAQELHLSDSQKEQLRTHLADKYAKLQEFRQQNPNISKTDLIKKIASARGALREQVARFLTPQQLEKWDAEIAKAKEFLGHSLAA